VARVFADELSLLRAAHAGRQLEFECDGDTRGGWDGMRLRQVLNNFVENAIKYGAHDAPVRVALNGDAEQLHFEVRNTGPIIDRETLHGIFDPLRRGVGQDARSAGRDSLGLGLYIAREIVEAHGGRIDARSDETQTVFAVRIPRNKARASSSNAPAAESAGVSP
jgi:signal transduction histidine kinase